MPFLVAGALPLPAVRTEVPRQSLIPYQQSIPCLVSAVLHLVAFLAFALFWQHRSGSISRSSELSIGIMLPSATPDGDDYFTIGSAESGGGQGGAGTSSAFSDGTTEFLPSLDATPRSTTVALPSESSSGFGGGSSGDSALPGAGQLIANSGPSARPRLGSPEGKAHTYLFGASAVGNTFVYVFDRSASMLGYEGRPLAAAKTELMKSLEYLDRVHQFQIVFYNDRVSVFNPHHPQPATLLFGDEGMKKAAERYIHSITGSGGTDHLQALRLALGMAPDAIFFLTDADEPQMSNRELATIQRLNHKGTIINSVQFGAGPNPGGDNFLKTLARQSGGQHVYVDVTTLPRTSASKDATANAQ